MIGILPLAIAAIGIAYAVLVIRAAPNRRDNVMFGVLAATDAAMTAWRGINVVAGDSITEAAVLLPCALCTAILAVISVEFIYAFPRSRPMTWAMRLGLWAWCAAGMVIIIAIDSAHEWGHSTAELVYFLPMTLVIFALGARAWRRTRERPARIVIAVLGARWAFGFSAYFIAPAFGWLEQAVWIETTVATLASFVVIGTSVLRSELFSLRSSVAEAITIATMGFVIVLGGGAAVKATLAYTAPGSTLQIALLIGATLVPVHLAAIGRALYPRLEKNVLAGLDERRALRFGVQADPLPIDAPDAIAEAIRRITAIGESSTVSWTPAAELPPRLADDLRDGLPRRKPTKRPIVRESEQVAAIDDLPACFVVPALGGGRRVVGAFYIKEGVIDRDTYIVARDLAAHVALAVERHTAVAALEDARRLAALGQFAAAIAHDIRTPLTSISLNIQILQRKLALPADDKEHLDIALEELHRLDRSVAEILDFAKPIRLVTESIDVGNLLETAAKNLTPVLSEKNIALRCEPTSARVHGDPQRLRQVLVNLVDNAAAASQPGAEVTLRAARTDSTHVAIEVEDRGKGIQADDLKRIFDPFFTTRPDGTGLGLAICHKVVTAHGGELRVKSSVGEGSTFTVLLPAA